jgi:hypothetical protein
VTLEELNEKIHEIEGEIMLAAFHGYRLPAFEDRLLELLKERESYE